MFDDEIYVLLSRHVIRFLVELFFRLTIKGDISSICVIEKGIKFYCYKGIFGGNLIKRLKWFVYLFGTFVNLVIILVAIPHSVPIKNPEVCKNC